MVLGLIGSFQEACGGMGKTYEGDKEMMILHLGDIHFRNDLLAEIEKCVDFAAKRAESSVRPDAIVIAGDVFDERQTYDSPAFLAADRYIRRLSRTAPVLIVKGTPSHDGQTLKFFENERVYVSEAPEQVLLTARGFIKYNGTVPGDAGALFSCLPSVSKASIAAFYKGSLSETSFNTVELMRDVLRGWGEVNARVRMNIPTVLVGHLSVTGAILSTGQQMVGREVELGVGDLRMAAADLVCLSHIHKAQNWGEVFYSGSITRLNFGEAEDKGFWIHSFEARKVASRFIKTPAREMVTVDCDAPPSPDVLEHVPEGACVRLRYQVSEEEVHMVDEKVLKEKLAAMGAAEIKIEKTVVPRQRVRAEGISRLASLDDKLRKWAETVGEDLPDGVFKKLALLKQGEDVCEETQRAEALAV